MGGGDWRLEGTRHWWQRGGWRGDKCLSTRCRMLYKRYHSFCMNIHHKPSQFLDLWRYRPALFASSYGSLKWLSEFYRFTTLWWILIGPSEGPGWAEPLSLGIPFMRFNVGLRTPWCPSLIRPSDYLSCNFPVDLEGGFLHNYHQLLVVWPFIRM